jgi:hypothetical protein
VSLGKWHTQIDSWPHACTCRRLTWSHKHCLVITVQYRQMPGTSVMHYTSSGLTDPATTSVLFQAYAAQSASAKARKDQLGSTSAAGTVWWIRWTSVQDRMRGMRQPEHLLA